MQTRRVAIVAVTVVAGLVGLAGCGSSGTSGTPATHSTMPTGMKMSHSPSMMPSPSTKSGTSPSTSAALITIKNYGYQGPTSVKPGATVMVKNEDTVNHTVTSDTGGAFDVIATASATVTFKAPTKPGTYPYHCTYHSNMHGSLVVK